MNSFKMKTDVRFGEGALASLGELSGHRVAVITDAAMVKFGALEKVKAHLTGVASLSVFSDVVPDPAIELVAAGLKFLQNAEADTVIALGGGSSIDAAKSVVFMAKQNGKSIQLIAIPTTSGTGSEVTDFAVITDKQAGRKYPLVDEALQPDVAILDPDLVASVPPSVTADTGFDVITHALEAYVSTAANDASDALAEKALELSFHWLPFVYTNGRDLNARAKMHSASCLAGMAFNAVSLGVNHGIAHALGAKFHIPHGRANAMLLPYVIAFNANLDGCFGTEPNEAAVRYAAVARRVGLPADNLRIGVESLIDELNYMLAKTKTPRTLTEAGVTKEALAREKDAIITAALADACTKTNPRPVTREDVEAILTAMQ